MAGYTVATATGALRMLNDRHGLTDVVAGASIGFLSAETAWRLYPVLAVHLPGHVGQKLLPTYALAELLGPYQLQATQAGRTAARAPFFPSLVLSMPGKFSVPGRYPGGGRAAARQAEA